jgi:hypothetical protein
VTGAEELLEIVEATVFECFAEGDVFEPSIWTSYAIEVDATWFGSRHEDWCFENPDCMLSGLRRTSSSCDSVAEEVAYSRKILHKLRKTVFI